MRTKIVAGNWKMNLTFQEAETLIEKITAEVETLDPEGVEVVLCPPFPYLELALDLTDETLVSVGAQNVSDRERGAFTGEVSASMLKSMEVEYCIIGHSERRQYFGETDGLLSQKVELALKEGIAPIFCCGEMLPEREQGAHLGVVERQLKEALFHLDEQRFRHVVIAYEPVWAIGTGKTATPEQAEEMHKYIRHLIGLRYGQAAAGEALILYGGSCNAGNARALFSQPDVDGGLIGGASLKAEEFLQIVDAAVVRP